MSERFADPPANAWTELASGDSKVYWATFVDKFGFRAGVSPDAWPAISEPTPSLTFDLSVIPDGPQRGAAYDAINAEALRAFVWALPDTELIVLDWQHTTYRFSPSRQALTWRPDWEVPVYPDGDYFGFLTEDFSEGTFGHPWEQTLCVIGDRLGAALGRSLDTWLPVIRRDGVPV